MVTIQDISLRQNVYETIYDLVTAISFGASTTVTVTAAYIEDDTALPQVVIHPVDVSMDEYVFNRGTIQRGIRVLIEVFSKKRKDLDIISDKILSTLETGSTPGIQLVGVDESIAFPIPEGLKIHSKAIALSYNRLS